MAKCIKPYAVQTIEQAAIVHKCSPRAYGIIEGGDRRVRELLSQDLAFLVVNRSPASSKVVGEYQCLRMFSALQMTYISLHSQSY